MPNPDLVAELALSPTEFNLKFKESPVKRSKRRGYLRNVAVALGNTGDSAAIQALEIAVQNSESLIREHARWALNKIKKDDVNRV